MGRTATERDNRAILIIAVLLATLATATAAVAQEAPATQSSTAEHVGTSTRGDTARPDPTTRGTTFVSEIPDLESLPANSGRTLVFGQDDNGFEGDTIATLLQDLGYAVERADRLPTDLSDYDIIWYIEAYRGLDNSEIIALQTYIVGGGSVYLTGERPCCEVLNGTVETVINGVLEEGRSVGVGGQGDVYGNFSFNASAQGGVVTQPNLLVDFIPDAPGAMTGWGVDTRAETVFASSEYNVVGAVWTEDELVGPGRLVILMDIDWIGEPGVEDVVQNIQTFLAEESCSDAGHWEGFTWLGGTPWVSPDNCSTILNGAEVTWSAQTDAGDGEIALNGTGVTFDCNEPSTGYFPGVTCRISLPPGESSGTMRVTATDSHGSTSRFYAVVQKNDLRNIPIPFSQEADWWQFPDADTDGIPDKWEADGVWVDGEHLNLPALGADPNRKDLFVYWDYLEDEGYDSDVTNLVTEAFADSPMRNPDGSTGITVHLLEGKEIPANVAPTVLGYIQDDYVAVANYSGFSASPWAGSADIPQLAKYFYIQDDLPCYMGANGRTCPVGRVASIPGNFGTLAIDDNWCRDNRLCDFFSDKPNLDFTRAVVWFHELGHLFGLRHHGAENLPNNDPAYKSVMSYAYSAFGVESRDGFLWSTRYRIAYSNETVVNRDWKMGEPDGSLTFVLGQYGEDPDFYTLGGNNEMRFGGGEPSDGLDGPRALGSTPLEVIEEITDVFGIVIPESVLDPCLHGGETPFADTSSSFAENQIRCIFNLGVTTGTSATTYSPHDYVTREQMAAFLKRLYNTIDFTPSCQIPSTPFTDIAGSFAVNDIACIYGLGITVGTSETTYSPGDLVTREQMAAFLVRLYREALGVEPPFTETPFVDIGNSFAERQIGQIYGLGVTVGTSPTTYSPGDFVTREQMAAFLTRLFLEIRP